MRSYSSEAGSTRVLCLSDFRIGSHGATPREAARVAVAAQHRTLLELRRRGSIGGDALQAVEEELDIMELTADPCIRALGSSR